MKNSEAEEPKLTPKQGLLKANDIILGIMAELDCPMCDNGEDICAHTDYIEISTFIKSMIAKLNKES